MITYCVKVDGYSFDNGMTKKSAKATISFLEMMFPGIIAVIEKDRK